MFEACQTQWRVVAAWEGMRFQGLEYSSVWSVIDGWALKRRGKVFNQVRLIEAGALSIINDR